MTVLKEAGLVQPCIVRLKLFTLDNRFIERIAGRLAGADRTRVSGELAAHVAGLQSV